jgi:hypothetical protein
MYWTKTYTRKCLYSSILVFRLRQRLSLSPGSWLGENWGSAFRRVQPSSLSLFQLTTSSHSSDNNPHYPPLFCPGCVVDICMVLRPPARHDTTPLRGKSFGMLQVYHLVFLRGAYNSNIIVFTSSSHANVPLKKSAEERLSRSKAHMPASLKPLNRHSRYPYMYLHACQPWLALPLAAYDTYDD